MVRPIFAPSICSSTCSKVMLLIFMVAVIKIVIISTTGPSTERTAQRTDSASRLARTRSPYGWHSDDVIAQHRTPRVVHTDDQILQHRNKVLSELRHAASKWNNTRSRNRYMVTFTMSDDSGAEGTPEELTCQFSRIGLRMLNGEDEPFSTNGLGVYFPREPLLGNEVFRTCAVVTNSGAMLGTNHGRDIDNHEAVLRFNGGVTFRFEEDVGTKTTLRVANSKLLSVPDWTEFVDAELRKGVPIVVWDPPFYHHSISQWLRKPDTPFWASYFQRRITMPDEDLYIMEPRAIWTVWETLQNNSKVAIVPHGPSSGFMGLMLMLQRCWEVDIYGFYPTLYPTKLCHYHDTSKSASCFVGGYHPAATEKLLVYRMTNSTDRDIFEKGVVRLKGFRQTKCDESI